MFFKLSFSITYFSNMKNPSLLLQYQLKSLNLMRIFFYSLLVSFFLWSSPGVLWAKLIEPAGLERKILDSYRKVFQLNLNIQVTIYDPEAFQPLEEENVELIQPREIPGQSYQQRIFWVRDEYLGIETLDQKGTPLHIFFEEGEQQLAQQLQVGRNFQIIDLQFPHFLFYTKLTSVLSSQLHQTGIAMNQIRMQQRENRMVYQLGTETENILVNPDNFRVIEINRLLQIKGRYYPFKVVFRDWDKLKKRIPRTTRFYINSRLFKEIKVTNLAYRGIAQRRNQFFKRYWKLLFKRSDVPVEINFAQ